MTTAKQMALVGASVAAFILSVFHIKGGLGDVASFNTAVYLLLLGIAVAIIEKRE